MEIFSNHERTSLTIQTRLPLWIVEPRKRKHQITWRHTDLTIECRNINSFCTLSNVSSWSWVPLKSTWDNASHTEILQLARFGNCAPLCCHKTVWESSYTSERRLACNPFPRDKYKIYECFETCIPTCRPVKEHSFSLAKNNAGRVQVFRLSSARLERVANRYFKIILSIQYEYVLVGLRYRPWIFFPCRRILTVAIVTRQWIRAN